MAVQLAVTNPATRYVNQVVEVDVKMLVTDANTHAKEIVTVPAEEDARAVLATNQCDGENRNYPWL